MVTCPMPGVLDPLIEYAKSIGLAEIAEQEVNRAYITINQNKQIGEELDIPTIEQFQDILETAGVFAPGLHSEVSPKREASFESLANVFPEYSVLVDPITLTAESQGKMKTSARVNRLLDVLSSNTGISYETITPEEAVEMTAAVQPWNGQPAFFFSGKVYIIPELITEKSVFHEFAHPVIRAIQFTNKPLFDNLVSQLMATETGMQILQKAKEAYPNAAEDDPIIMEEALVIALTEGAVQRPESAFNKFVSNLLYAIKQFLRKLFGKEDKITIEKLKADTTLEQLADMLILDKFTLDLDAVSQDDIVAWYTSLDEVIKDFNTFDTQKLQDATNDMYTVITKHINLLQKNKDYKALEQIIKDKYNKSDLEEIRKNLAPYQDATTFITQEASKIMDEIKTANSHTVAFIQSLDRTLQMVTRMNDALTQLARDTNSKDNVATVFYYNDILNEWESFLDSFNEKINQAKLEGEILPDNPIFELVGKIEAQIESARISTRKVYFNGTSELIKTQLKPMATYIDQKYQKLMDDITKLGLSEKTRLLRMKDYWGLEEEELKAFLAFKARVDAGEVLKGVAATNYEILKRKSYKQGAYLTDEKIDYLMQGNLGDAYGLNSFLEGYIYNQDPIVFGFALWVKNRVTDVLTNAQNKGNAFMTDVRPILERAGYNQSNPAAFGAKITFIDRKPARDASGNVKDEEVYTLINPYKDHRAVIAKMEKDIEDAILKANQTGDDSEAIRLKLEKDIFMRNYFHTPYKAEYYERYKIFKKDENDTIGPKAEALRLDLLARIQNLSTMIDRSTQDENLETIQNLDVLWREYRLLHSNYNAAGQLKNAEGIAIAERLREFREASKDLYREEILPNMFTDSLAAYEAQIDRKGYNDQVKQIMRQQWIARNSRIKIKEQYYKDYDALIAEQKAILAKLPANVLIDANIAEGYDEIRQLLSPYRDEDLQPDATAMSLNNIAAVKDAQIKLQELKKNLTRKSGLTQLEQEELSEFFSRKAAGERLLGGEYNRFQYLLDKKKLYGLSKKDKERLDEISAELEEMSQSLPTEYYLQTINNILSLAPALLVNKYLEGKDVTVDNADSVLTEDFYNLVISKVPEIKQWFDENHIMTEAKDKAGVPYTKIERVKAWSISRPKDARYYETFTFTNTKGEDETILGVPSIQYYTRVVKDKYINKQVTMLEALKQGDPTLATMDNKGNYLPRLDAPDRRFVNEQFFDIKKNDKPLYDAILALSKYHLEFQEGNPPQSKLYLDIPRFMSSTYEQNLRFLAADKTQENPISSWGRRLRAFFVSSPDDYDRGFNYEEQKMIMETDMYDDQYAGIPIHGLSALSTKDTSLDVVGGMLRYMLSAEKQRALIEMNPMARALQSVLHDPDNYVNIQKNISTFQQKNRNILNAMTNKARWKQPSKDKSVRQKAIDNFIEREFQGIVNKGALKTDSDVRWITKTAEFIMKRSAFGYFALDIPSALKNDFSLRIQSMIEAAGGQYFNNASYGKGQLWATNTAMQVSMNLYSGQPKTHNEQLVNIFDAYQGRFEEKFEEQMSRSFAKDALGGLTWMTSFRKWTELNSTISIFGAMMYHQKIDRTVNGVTEKISYMDAWETIDGQIRLKDGIDPSWGIGGDNFKAFKNKVQGVTNNLAGSFAKFDYADADRYLLFKWIIAFKRWFVRMFLNRFQYRGSLLNPRYRFDAAVGDTVMGYHIQTLRYLARSIKGGSDYYRSIRDEEKAAAIKSLVDAASIGLFVMAVSMIFGYDDKDPDRFEKLRQKSGPLPFLATEETDVDFNFMGWLSNHALMMTMSLKNEQTQWLSGGNYMEMLTLDSVAMHNTFDNYGKIMGGLITHASHNLFGTDDSKAYFDQREGPYTWMQEGGTDDWYEGSKTLTYLARSFGLTGKSLDPAMAVTNFVKAQNWK